LDLFQRPLVVSPTAEIDASALRVATTLATPSGGQVAEKASVSAADLAAERGASLIVVAKQSGTGSWRSGIEAWLRSCTLPMLFVPAE
jgi:hypothetical protein